MTEKAMDSQQAKLAALYEVSARLGTTLDQGELLNYVMDAIIQLTGAERGFLMLINELTGELETVAARNVDARTIEGESMDISRTVVRRAAANAEGIVTNNAQEDTRFASQQSVVGFQLRSIMCAPLSARGRVIGAAYVDNRLFSGVFNQADLDLMVAFANQAAMAIDNARLFAQTDQALARRVAELDLFQRIDRELNSSLDLNRVLSQALEWAVTLTKANGGSIGLMEEEEKEDGDVNQYLRVLAFQHESERSEPRHVPANHPVLAEVLASGNIVLTKDVRPEQSIDGSPAAFQLAVPIKREGRVTGLITLEGNKENPFQDEDITFVERWADRAAVTITNARLYDAVQSANEAKSQFVSLVTHELRIPMTSIKGYVDLLSRGLAGPLNDQQTQFLGVVQRNLDRMRTLISDLSDINRIESGRMRFEFSEFDVREVVEDVADSLREAIGGRQQTLTLNMPAEPVIVHADRTRTGQVMTNLVSNAYKYTPDGGTITVDLTLNGQMAHLAVVDTGIGISAEDQIKLFSQFFRSENEAVREQTGWGLGLSIVKMMVEAQGGEVTFASELGKGSTFAFSVPLRE